MFLLFSPLFKSYHGFATVMKPQHRMGLGSRGFLEELIYKTCLAIHCSTLTGCTRWWDSGTCLSVIAAKSNMENTLLQCT